LRPLRVEPLPEYDEEAVGVSREALVRVGRQAYSVPARFVGKLLRARVRFLGESTPPRGTFFSFRHRSVPIS